MESKARSSTLSAVLPSALALGWIIAGVGCETKPPPDQLAQAVAVGERPVAMEGSSTFHGGTVAASITISRGIGKGLPGGKGKHSGANATIPDVSSMENDEAVAYYNAKRAVGSPLPPVTIRLKLKNLTGGPLDVSIDDFDSDLGNFAVVPSPLNLPANQEIEPEPMISQLGVTSDDISFKVTLKLNGRKETQVIHVKSIAGASPPS